MEELRDAGLDIPVKGVQDAKPDQAVALIAEMDQ